MIWILKENTVMKSIQSMCAYIYVLVYIPLALIINVFIGELKNLVFLLFVFVVVVAFKHL